MEVWVALYESKVVNKFFKNVHNDHSCNTMMTPLTTD